MQATRSRGDQERIAAPIARESRLRGRERHRDDWVEMRTRDRAPGAWIKAITVSPRGDGERKSLDVAVAGCGDRRSSREEPITDGYVGGRRCC
jgi:hypothetical protein